MSVMIHGKEYRTVAERVAEIREAQEDWSIVTDLVKLDDEYVVMKAIIMDGDKIISTGFAEERRDASTINKTSALENCETSAVGRAAAFAGFAGTEIASADEVAAAIKQQAAKELIEYNELVRNNWHTVAEVKNLLHPQWGEMQNQPNVTDARAMLKELGDETYRALWKAPTKGGIFTTVERTLLKEPEKAEAIVGAAAL